MASLHGNEESEDRGKLSSAFGGQTRDKMKVAIKGAVGALCPWSNSNVALIQGDPSAITNFNSSFPAGAGLVNNSTEASREILHLANMTPEQRAIMDGLHKNGITIEDVMRIDEDQIKEIIRQRGMDPDKDGAPLVSGFTEWSETIKRFAKWFKTPVFRSKEDNGVLSREKRDDPKSEKSTKPPADESFATLAGIWATFCSVVAVCCVCGAYCCFRGFPCRHSTKCLNHNDAKTNDPEANDSTSTMLPNPGNT